MSEAVKHAANVEILSSGASDDKAAKRTAEMKISTQTGETLAASLGFEL